MLVVLLQSEGTDALRLLCWCFHHLDTVLGCKIKVVSSLDSLILIFISAEIIGYCEETLRCWV